jgi:hypothetical protein
VHYPRCLFYVILISNETSSCDSLIIIVIIIIIIIVPSPWSVAIDWQKAIIQYHTIQINDGLTLHNRNRQQTNKANGYSS